MKKLSFVFVIFIFFSVSCTNSSKSKNENVKQDKQSTIIPTPEKATIVTVADFKDKAAGLVGKTVIIEGTVDHVCKHGGQKMILISENTENRVKITPNDKLAAFKPEMEGEEVKVTGTVAEMKVDENYLNEWEDEVKEGITKKEGKVMHENKNESKQHADNSNNREENSEQQAFEQIENLRKKLKNSGKGHLSYYSIVCSEYKVLKSPENR